MYTGSIMKTSNKNVKYTRGRSTVERATKQEKVNITFREKAQNFPIKLFNSLTNRKKV